MSNDVKKMVEEIKALKQNCSHTIMGGIDHYIYRETRYKTSFSVVMIYSNISFEEIISQIKSKLRHTDKVVCLRKNLFCIIFDSVEADSYLKVAENLFTILKAIDYHADYYIATTFSKNFDGNYLNMLNKLFERVEYSVSHGMSDIVDNEDYLI